MSSIERGRSMEAALYLTQNKKYKKIQAVEVLKSETMQKKKFYCKDCFVQVTFVKGGNRKDSKPFFRKHVLYKHHETCGYYELINLVEKTKKVGIENVNFEVKPPFVEFGNLTQDQLIEEGEKSKKRQSRIKNGYVKGKISIERLYNVDNLFQVIYHIKNLNNGDGRTTLHNKLYNNIYYPYYDDARRKLIEHAKNKTIKPYFFVAGVLEVKEFRTLRKDPPFALLLPRYDGQINIRIFPVINKVNKKLLDITFKTKQNSKKYNKEFIGVMASFKGLVEENDRLIIELDAYDADLNRW